MKTLVLAAFGGAVVTLSASQGAVITQTRAFGPGTPDFSQQLTFDRYDGFLSELISVQVELRLDSAGGLLRLDNDAAGGVGGTAEIGASALLTSPDVPLLDKFLQPVVGLATASSTSPFSLAGNDGDADGKFNAGGPDTADIPGSAASKSLSGTISSTFLSDFVGADSFGVNVSAHPILSFAPSNGVSFTGELGTASGSVVITYTYEKDPVPAPAALPLLGLGGVMAVRRRR